MLYAIWSQAFKNFEKGSHAVLNEIDNALQLSNLAINYGCDPNIIEIPSCGSIIHFFILYYRSRILKDPSFHLAINKYHDIFSSMVKMGCELEGRDQDEDTALLSACYLPEPNMIAALIDIGADINATDGDGDGVLHHILYARKIHCDFENLGRGLEILLINKADPNHLNNFGLSPSDHASVLSIKVSLWDKAVEHAGYKTLVIKGVLPQCGHLEEVTIIVSAGFEVDKNSTLPISNLTVEEWLKRRYERTVRFFECQKCVSQAKVKTQFRKSRLPE